MPESHDSASAAGGAAGSGVIHDIGYRNYTGPRLGRGYIVRSLWTHSLRGAYGLGRSGRAKVLPMTLFGLMCAPAVIMVAITASVKLDELPIPYTRYALVMQAIVAIYLASQAPQLVSRDLRFRTTSLYFSRPLSRADYVVAKFLSMVTAMFVFTAVPLLILYVGALLAKLDFGEQTKNVLLALVGVLLLSLLLTSIGLLIASSTPRRGFGVAGVIAVLTLSYAAASSLQGIADEQGSVTAAGWLGLISPITIWDGVQVFLFDVSSSGVSGPPGTSGGLVFLLVLLALTASCVGLLFRRYRKVSAL